MRTFGGRSYTKNGNATAARSAQENQVWSPCGSDCMVEHLLPHTIYFAKSRIGIVGECHYRKSFFRQTHLTDRGYSQLNVETRQLTREKAQLSPRSSDVDFQQLMQRRVGSGESIQ